MDFDWLKWLLFSFKGRIGRQVWWLSSLAVAVIAGMTSSVIDVAATTSGGSTINPESQAFEPSAPYSLLLLAVGLLNIWINYALAVKRLHDRDRTGWWLVAQLLSVVVAAGLIGAAFAVPEDQSDLVLKLGIAAAVVAIGFGLWLFVEIGFLKGTQGPNRYGADRLGAGQDDAKL